MNMLKATGPIQRSVYLAVNIDRQCTSTALIDENCNILKNGHYDNRGDPNLIRACATAIEKFLATSRHDFDQPLAIGVSSQGQVKEGLIYVNRRDRFGINFKGDLEKQFRKPTCVLNRFQALALGVSALSNKVPNHCIGVINISNSVGFGIVASGSVKDLYDNNGSGGLRKIARLSSKRFCSIVDIAGAKNLRSECLDMFGQSSINALFEKAQSNRLAEMVIDDAADAVAEMVVSITKEHAPHVIYGLVYDDDLTSDVYKQSFLQKVNAMASKKMRQTINVELVNISESKAKLIGASVFARKLQPLPQPRQQPLPQPMELDLPPNIFVITGKPGCGKTTFVGSLLKDLSREGFKIGGFISEERRNSQGKRSGFSMRLLSPSKQESLVNLAEAGKINKLGFTQMGAYSVNVQNINEIVVPLIREVKIKADIIIMDEIASMQLLSRNFEYAIEDVLLSKKPMIITIPIQSKKALVERIRKQAKNTNTLIELSAFQKQKSQDEAFKKIFGPVMRLLAPVQNDASDLRITINSGQPSTITALSSRSIETQLEPSERTSVKRTRTSESNDLPTQDAKRARRGEG